MTRRRSVSPRVARDTRGTALMEFALALPLVLAMGGYGVELANLAITNLRVSQIAMQLADNASRIGVNNGAATYQLREGDLNDVLQGARLLGTGLKLTTYGRVTLSSLENITRTYTDQPNPDSAPVQRIHWQRCIGVMTGYGTATAIQFDSSYGAVSPLVTAGSDATYANRGTTVTGMGATPLVSAPSGSGVVFVEVNYQYQPLFGTLYVKPTKIHYVSSFIVRDRRDFSQIFPSAAASGTPTPVASTCDKHAA